MNEIKYGYLNRHIVGMPTEICDITIITDINNDKINCQWIPYLPKYFHDHWDMVSYDNSKILIGKIIVTTKTLKIPFYIWNDTDSTFIHYKLINMNNFEQNVQAFSTYAVDEYNKLLVKVEGLEKELQNTTRDLLKEKDEHDKLSVCYANQATTIRNLLKEKAEHDRQNKKLQTMNDNQCITIQDFRKQIEDLQLRLKSKSSNVDCIKLDYLRKHNKELTDTNVKLLRESVFLNNRINEKTKEIDRLNEVVSELTYVLTDLGFTVLFKDNVTTLNYTPKVERKVRYTVKEQPTPNPTCGRDSKGRYCKK